MSQDRTARAEEMRRAVGRILVFALSLLCLALFALWRLDNPRAEAIRMQVVDGLAPAMEWTNRPARFASDMVTDFQNFTRVYEQNAELRREIQRLHAWREAAQQLEQENARLRALNNVRLAPSAGFVTGEVIADSGGPFLQTGLANVGSADGVRDGAAVMDGAGLVGRVVGLGRHAARVLFVTDYSSRVPVIIRPSGRRAILTGDGASAPRLEFLEAPEGVSPGDRVVTSGDGKVFPPDLPVGAALLGPGAQPRVLLAADLPRLEFVRVMRYEPDTALDQEGGLVGAEPEAPAEAPEPAPEDPDAPIVEGAAR
ncbi:rod shape-determining protein MreC [Rhodovulum sp. DZ06]|uniref:rod shape-determining protein MreC n=1 Tax=Rhodovulum sp. DZ06 TaxID=3425126 RepID=UPI003D3340EB